MNLQSARALCVSLLLCFLPLSAFALAGDAPAVLAHCGPPSSDEVLHPDTLQRLRVISYADIQLVFTPAGNDWSYSRAVRAGAPLAQDALFDSMHCVSDALEEVSAAPPVAAVVATPATIEKQSSEASHETIFITVATILVLGVLFFAIRPYMKSEAARPATTVAPRAPQRRPSATGIKFRRPEDPNPSGITRIPEDNSTNRD